MSASGAAFLAGDRGHSLVEVMVSIVILCVAIIPMVSMFDVGLSLATGGGHHDNARAFATEQLELATAMSYDAVRDTLPAGASAPDGGGSYASSEQPVPASAGLPEGATYSITRKYVEVVPPPSGAGNAVMTETGIDGGMLRVDVVVSWEDHTHGVSGVSAEDVR
jgi:hypothetical protein